MTTTTKIKETKTNTNTNTTEPTKQTIVQKRQFPDLTTGYDLNWIFRINKVTREKFYCCDGLKDLVVRDGGAFIVNHNGLVIRLQNNVMGSNQRLKVCPSCDTPIEHIDDIVLKNEDIKAWKEEAKLENNQLNA